MSDSGPPVGSFDNWAFPPQPPSWPSAPQVPPPRRTARALTLVAAIIATVLIGAVGGVAVAFATRDHQPSPAPGSNLPPGSTSPTSPSTSQASALYQRALITTRGSNGFAYVSVSTGPQSETIAGVAGQLGGRQVIIFESSYGVEHFTLLLVGATVYFQGNMPAVEDQLGVAAAHAAKLAGKWVSVVSGNGPYSVLQPGITVADQAQEMPLVPSRLASLTTTGAPATRILGSFRDRAGNLHIAHLDLVTASAIPLSYVASFAGGGTTGTTTTTYSQWGTAPSVSAPSGAVAWSTLLTSTPPGGYGNGGATPASPSASPTAQPAI
ncbi:MAG TPA: hypothetical protein VIM76_09615 [Candidatus Dormibacteraeota bacterium]